MENKIELSIITPVMNGENFIEECIQNFIGQNCSKAEHIIVDGLSQDKTIEIVKEYAKKYSHIKWVSQKDMGQSDAMNTGIKMASGKIISFLNVDDFFQPNAFNRALEIFKNLKMEEPSFIYGNTIIWHEDEYGNYFPHHLWRPKYTTFDDLALNFEENMHCPNPTGYFYHKSLHDIIGGYDTRIQFGMDVDFILKAFKNSKQTKYFDEIWGNYRFIKGTKTYYVCTGDRKNGWSEYQEKDFLKIILKFQKEVPILKKWKKRLSVA